MLPAVFTCNIVKYVFFFPWVCMSCEQSKVGQGEYKKYKKIFWHIIKKCYKNVHVTTDSTNLISESYFK